MNKIRILDQFLLNLPVTVPRQDPATWAAKARMAGLAMIFVSSFSAVGQEKPEKLKETGLTTQAVRTPAAQNPDKISGQMLQDPKSPGTPVPHNPDKISGQPLQDPKSPDNPIPYNPDKILGHALQDSKADHPGDSPATAGEEPVQSGQGPGSVKGPSQIQPANSGTSTSTPAHPASGSLQETVSVKVGSSQPEPPIDGATTNYRNLNGPATQPPAADQFPSQSLRDMKDQGPQPEPPAGEIINSENDNVTIENPNKQPEGK